MPRKSEKYLLGQDVIWTQFNDINFYVEDIDQENFYLQVLKKLFPEIKIGKIFPLGGKDSVINLAKKSLKTKKKVFILDLDFDEILGRKENLNNIFYLDRYCIENYLIDKDAIIEIIKEENPRITETEIKRKFDFDNFLREGTRLYQELICHVLLINKFQLGLNYLKVDISRDCVLNTSPPSIKASIINPYYLSVKTKFENKHPRFKFTTQLNKLVKFFRTIKKSIINIPGKYWISYLKIFLRKTFTFGQCSMDVFTYRLAKNCNFTDLNYLRVDIIKYTK